MKRTARMALARCGLTEGVTEVGTAALVRLGEFEIRKDDGTSYFVVKGPMPIEQARELYAHPIGRTDIRAGGDCGAREPETWLKWRLDGDEVVVDADGTKEAEWRGFCERYSSGAGSLPARDLIFHCDPASLGARAFVESYHVDSELGLYVLVQHIRRLQLRQGDDPMRDYLEQFRSKLDSYERLVEEANRKIGPADGLDHLAGFFRCIRMGHAFPLREDDDVERALQAIAGDIEYHQRTLVRCLEAVGPVDAIGSFRRLTKALVALGVAAPRRATRRLRRKP